MMFELTTPFPNALMYLVLEDDPVVPDIDPSTGHILCARPVN